MEMLTRDVIILPLERIWSFKFLMVLNKVYLANFVIFLSEMLT